MAEVKPYNNRALKAHYKLSYYLLSVMINMMKSAHAISITDTAQYDCADTQKFQFEDNAVALNNKSATYFLQSSALAVQSITCNTNNNKLIHNSLQQPLARKIDFENFKYGYYSNS